MADFLFSDHGSIWLMFPQNDGAREYAADVLPEDTPMHGEGYAVEPRYVATIYVVKCVLQRQKHVKENFLTFFL